MAGTVTIGGKELRVLHVKERGSFSRDLALARLGEEMTKTKGAEKFTKLAEMIHCYVAVNEEATLEWLIAELPADVGDILEACATAAGRKSSKGEAETPEPHT